MPLNPRGLGEPRLYYPSYVSLEYALGRHGWIPEGIVTITCATSKRFRGVRCLRVRTLFLQTDPPGDVLLRGGDVLLGGRLLFAGPSVEGACGLCLRESARVDKPGSSAGIPQDRRGRARYAYRRRFFDGIQGNYRTAPDVEAFLSGLREDLRL
ncbi:MAG: hypothetical protein MZV63_07285 [Marinilabiliales bacterium]|nr:hypothetical protein [Marinilabiliales bacterium]